MRKSIPMAGFVDRQDERESLIAVHKKCLAALLEVVRQEPDDERLRVECIRFFDESLWAVTEIRPGLKHDTRFVSKGVKDMIDAHNKSPGAWVYDGPVEGWRGRTDPRKCAVLAPVEVWDRTLGAFVKM